VYLIVGLNVHYPRVYMMCDIIFIAEIFNLISILRNCALNGCYILCIAQLFTLSSVSCSFYLTQCFFLQGHRFAVDEPWFPVRTERDIPAASKSGSSAVSFASSSSSAGSTSGSGTAPGYNNFNARSGSLDGAPGGLIA
jgi:hypothetical protein